MEKYKYRLSLIWWEAKNFIDLNIKTQKPVMNNNDRKPPNL